MTLVIAGVAAVAYFVGPAFTPTLSEEDRPLTVPVERGTLRVTVTERGNLESSATIDGICELIGSQNKLIQLIPEGSRVKKGDVVCRFDSSEIEKNIAAQEIRHKAAVTRIETSKQEVEIMRNDGESAIIDATVEFDLARLDLEKYEKGDYLAELDDIKGAIKLANKDLEKAKDELEGFRGLMKKGFKSPQQIRVAEQELERQTLYLNRDSLKKEVKEKYEYKRKMTELNARVDSGAKKVARSKANARAKLAKANSEFESAVATEKIERQQLEWLLQQREKTVIYAAQDGIVAFANDRYYDSSSQIREGAMVYSRQKIFSLPDLSKMQVKVNIHESFIKKIKPGLKAEIRVDAIPDMVLSGTVKSVSSLADSTRGRSSGGVKEYVTIVTIDKLEMEGLKPGMTSEVRILVKEIPDAIIVPIQAVAERKGEFFVFVETSVGFERRKVKAGDTNDKYVCILEGLEENEVVALDARLRAAESFRAMDEEEKHAPSKPKTTASGPIPPS